MSSNELNNQRDKSPVRKLDKSDKVSKSDESDISEYSEPELAVMVPRNSPYSDVTLNGFPVHALIISKSSVLRNMINDVPNSMRNVANKPIINIPFSRRITNKIIQFMYGDSSRLTLECYSAMDFLNLMTDNIMREIFLKHRQ
jgi:hypothetical protein